MAMPVGLIRRAQLSDLHRRLAETTERLHRDTGRIDANRIGFLINQKLAQEALARRSASDGA